MIEPHVSVFWLPIVSWNGYRDKLNTNVPSTYIHTRRLEGSTNQAYSNRFYIRISGILNIDGTTILFPQFSGGPQKYKHKVGQIEIISGCEVFKAAFLFVEHVNLLEY